MNDAHLHLLVNHFPIIGLIFGIIILISGMTFKNKSIINTAYGLFIIAALFSALSMATGEGAEEMVENMPNIGKKIIHEHEEIAEKFAVLLYVLGVFSIAGIYLNFINNSKSKTTSYLIILLAAIGVYFAQKTGATGGEIRHTEIRSTASNSATLETNTEHEDD